MEEREQKMSALRKMVTSAHRQHGATKGKGRAKQFICNVGLVSDMLNLMTLQNKQLYLCYEQA